MVRIVEPTARLVAWTEFAVPSEIDFSAPGTDGQSLVEFAGRSCYLAWDRARPSTADNADYLRHLLQVGHLTPFEHASASIYLTGLSTTAGHELLRHRTFSFSQLSPRQQAAESSVVEPAAVAADPELHARFVAAVRAAEVASAELRELLLAGGDGKPARQAAGALAPAASETRLVMTGNYRAWRQFIGARGSEHADREVRSVALACLRLLRELAPNAFADFAVQALPDGSELAMSPLTPQA